MVSYRGRSLNKKHAQRFVAKVRQAENGLNEIENAPENKNAEAQPEAFLHGKPKLSPISNDSSAQSTKLFAEKQELSGSPSKLRAVEGLEQRELDTRKCTESFETATEALPKRFPPDNHTAKLSQNSKVGSVGEVQPSHNNSQGKPTVTRPTVDVSGTQKASVNQSSAKGTESTKKCTGNDIFRQERGEATALNHVLVDPQSTIQQQEEKSTAANILQLCWWRELSDTEKKRIAKNATDKNFAPRVQNYMRTKTQERKMLESDKENNKGSGQSNAHKELLLLKPRECPGARRLHRQRMLLQAKEELGEKCGANPTGEESSNGSPISNVDDRQFRESTNTVVNVPREAKLLSKTSKWTKKEVPPVTRDRSRVELSGLYRSAFRVRYKELVKERLAKKATEPKADSHSSKKEPSSDVNLLDSGSIALDPLANESGTRDFSSDDSSHRQETLAPGKILLKNASKEINGQLEQSSIGTNDSEAPDTTTNDHVNPNAVSKAVKEESSLHMDKETKAEHPSKPAEEECMVGKQADAAESNASFDLEEEHKTQSMVVNAASGTNLAFPVVSSYKKSSTVHVSTTTMATEVQDLISPSGMVDPRRDLLDAFENKVTEREQETQDTASRKAVGKAVLLVAIMILVIVIAASAPVWLDRISILISTLNNDTGVHLQQNEDEIMTECENNYDGSQVCTRSM